MTPAEVAACIQGYHRRMIDLHNIIAVIPHAIHRVMGGTHPLSDFQVRIDD